MSTTSSPVIFMQDQRLKAEAAIEPDPVSTSPAAKTTQIIAIYDVSGDAALLDQLVMRLAPGGEIVLAGFYSEPVQFSFAPAFMREAQIRCAAEWHRNDLMAVTALAESGAFSLDGLITHRAQAEHAAGAYVTAFGDSACLKMVLDWRHTA